jgi:hypothetical protein
MNKLKLTAVLFLVAILSVTACKKDEENNDDNTDSSTLKSGTVTLDKTEMYKDDWVYFSFETLAEVEGIDSTNFNSRTDWDIAFHSRLGRTNGGNSGVGKAGIFDTEITDYSSIIHVDTNLLTSDTTVLLITGIGNMGPTYKTVPGNTTFDSAFDVDFTQHPPSYTATKNTFVLRTAKGKYAKIQIQNYFDEHGESGHITFKYTYQTNGSTELK